MVGKSGRIFSFLFVIFLYYLNFPNDLAINYLCKWKNKSWLFLHYSICQPFNYLKTLRETLKSTTAFQTFGLSSMASPPATNLKKFNIITFTVHPQNSPVSSSIYYPHFKSLIKSLRDFTSLIYLILEIFPFAMDYPAYLHFNPNLFFIFLYTLLQNSLVKTRP